MCDCGGVVNHNLLLLLSFPLYLLVFASLCLSPPPLPSSSPLLTTYLFTFVSSLHFPPVSFLLSLLSFLEPSLHCLLSLSLISPSSLSIFSPLCSSLPITSSLHSCPHHALSPLTAAGGRQRPRTDPLRLGAAHRNLAPRQQLREDLPPPAGDRCCAAGVLPPAALLPRSGCYCECGQDT